jgi:TolA-binding protein
MRCARISLLVAAILVAAILVAACAGTPERQTLAELRRAEPDMTEVRVENSLDQAIVGYRSFLEEAPESALTPEAMRRLADLELEKEYGILGGDRPNALPVPQRADVGESASAASARTGAEPLPDAPESDAEFEQRAAASSAVAQRSDARTLETPGGASAAPEGPLEALALYDQILADYPNYRNNDQVLYQKARAYDELGRTEDAIAVMERLIAEYPRSRHLDEVQFRRAEYFFTRRRYLDAEEAYAAIARLGSASEYYELALYKLGWTLYKQDLHEEALDQYVALLDFKVSTGYDFDQAQDEDAERRIADTFRVISLSFSNLGGPESVEAYFATKGTRSYEDRIYAHLGEFYFEKLRYQDAAAAYQAFVSLHPLHRASPHFGMRVVEIYEAGGFSKLVLESKKEFAARYELRAEYWRHFDVGDSPEVLRYLKANVADLANHYHALYQQADLVDDRPSNLDEALRWYRTYLGSFPADPETPSLHYRLADLILEHEDFAAAAIEYERTAYDYPAHAQAAAAGYAAIYAHRQRQERESGEERSSARRDAVQSTLRFVDAFPAHEHAAAVLGAAADDLYEMKDFARAIAAAQRVIDGYPQADPSIRRSAWTAVAHSSFDLAAYPQAEQAYTHVVEMTAEDDASRQAVVENLAASIYKQGEQANLADDSRSAAEHFLRIARVAPASQIRPAAEYDAGAALIRAGDLAGATAVLETFREAHPDHPLEREATKQMASVYRDQGDLARAAAEYERVAAEADDAELRREALLLAGDLHERSGHADRALAVQLEYVAEFPRPVETAVEMRFKIAQAHHAAHDEASYHAELQRIVEIDAGAAEERTPRSRDLAGRSALILSEQLYAGFAEVELTQPFERNLQEKRRRMDAALEAMGRLVDYEIGEFTAAATFYMAEIYLGFSRALLASERPADLDPAERAEYEAALEEEAFPFEDEAIAVHEKNLELIAAGVHGRWIEKSLARLVELVPGRYAKPEASSGWIDTIDRYVYRAPDDGAGDREVSDAKPL